MKLLLQDLKQRVAFLMSRSLLLAAAFSLLGLAAVAQDQDAQTQEVVAQQGRFTEKSVYTREEVEEIRRLLQGKSEILAKKIEKEKKQMVEMQTEIATQIGKMKEIRQRIEDYMGQRDEIEEAKIKKLAKFYESMEAESAGPLMEKVAENLAIRILEKMDPKKAGGILGTMQAARARQITQRFPKLRIPVAQADQ